MISLERAIELLETDGFVVAVDYETDGLVELIAKKDGYSETFFDCKLEEQCSTYLAQFDETKFSIVKYANKSIEILKKNNASNNDTISSLFQ